MEAPCRMRDIGNDRETEAHHGGESESSWRKRHSTHDSNGDSLALAPLQTRHIFLTILSMRPKANYGQCRSQGHTHNKQRTRVARCAFLYKSVPPLPRRKRERNLPPLAKLAPIIITSSLTDYIHTVQNYITQC